MFRWLSPGFLVRILEGWDIKPLFFLLSCLVVQMAGDETVELSSPP